MPVFGRREFLLLAASSAAYLAGCQPRPDASPTPTSFPTPTKFPPTPTAEVTLPPTLLPTPYPTEVIAPTPDNTQILNAVESWFAPQNPVFVPTSETIFGFSVTKLLVGTIDSHPHLLAINTPQGWILNLPQTNLSSEIASAHLNSLIRQGYGLNTILELKDGEPLAYPTSVITSDHLNQFFEFPSLPGTLLRFHYDRWTPWVINPETQIEHTFFPALLSDYRGFYAFATTDEQLISLAPPLTPRILISIDDGYWPDETTRILNLASENSWPLTFYLNTNYLATQAEVLTRILTEGHELGYHTSNHLRYGWTSPDWLYQDLTSFEEFIRQQTGITSYKTRSMRPPQGYWNWDWLNFSAAANIPTILWNYYNEDPSDPKIFIPSTLKTESSVILLHTRPECVVWLQDNADMLNQLSSQYPLTQTSALIARQGTKVELLGYPSTSAPAG